MRDGHPGTPFVRIYLNVKIYLYRIKIIFICFYSVFLLLIFLFILGFIAFKRLLAFVVSLYYNNFCNVSIILFLNFNFFL
ncbi:hypothetical protein HMPREF3293_00940 [Christensenella minuta]|uniref:Uncharacterized protein n=1 Tax=Christensenella minuta TaxID=626937 RepID=A0A136Q6H7_9FIRM|nr:hypothetical protein HMPREF3293_00940 [Christensenella minuta]